MTEIQQLNQLARRHGVVCNARVRDDGLVSIRATAQEVRGKDGSVLTHWCLVPPERFSYEALLAAWRQEIEIVASLVEREQ